VFAHQDIFHGTLHRCLGEAAHAACAGVLHQLEQIRVAPGRRGGRGAGREGLGAGCWLQGVGCWVGSEGVLVGFRVWGLGF